MINFTKMHGLGSSYVLFNLLEDPMENADFPELSKLVSNVNVGIGSDGIILICPSDRADFKMRVFKRRGLDQIRTDVQAFAELCLAARPRYLYAIRGANIKKYFTSPHFL